MISYTITTDPIMDQKTDSCIFMISKEALTDETVWNATSETFKNFIEQYIPSFKTIVKKQKFTGQVGQVCVIPVSINDNIVHCIFTGVTEGGDIEKYRRALGHAIKKATSCGHSSVALQVTSIQAKYFGVLSEQLAQQMVEVTEMSTYSFDDYKSKEEENETDLYEVIVCADTSNISEVENGIAKGTLIGHCVNKARHWVDLPPSDLTPPHLANKANDIAQKYGLDITIFDEQQAIAMGMGGLAGVSRGSDNECRLVIMQYKTNVPSAQTVAIVGKGITFDSGGLSLKPPRYMETMKEDMSGAAAVIATMEAIAQIKPDVNVVGVTPLSENLPSGKATKPGDILRFYNGKTAEVKNTDAEGRLVLADALSYTVEQFKPDAIIDLATLTGACAYALGPFYTGLFSEHDDLAQKVMDAGNVSGDLMWRLPLGDDYKKAIKSSVADICNIGSDKIQAGATTAAHFLQHFVEDTPWVHLDIAGTAFGVPNKPYYKDGATGVGVRLLVQLLTHWNK